MKGRWMVLAVAVGAPLFGSPPARADETTTSVATEAAKLFELGRQSFVEKKYAEALDTLERSYSLLPSPNSLLLIARCQRELGRPEDAAKSFAEAASQADARALGDASYTRTAEVARSEGAAVRATLGLLRIRAPGAPPGSTIEAPHARAAVNAGMAELSHRPGTVVVTLRQPNGASSTQTAKLTAGSFATLVFDLEAGTKPVAAPRTERRSSVSPERDSKASSTESWMFPTGLVFSGIGVVGLAAFAGFGSASENAYSDLYDKCGKNGTCGAGDRDRADTAERQQTYANIGLAVGLTTLAAGATLLILGWPKSETSARVPNALRF